VLEGALDFALVHGGRTGGPLRARLLDRQPVGVALSSDLPLAANDSVSLGDLCALSWATIDQQAAPSIYRRTDALLARNGVLKRAVIDSTNVADLLHLVLDGNAFALVGLKAGATRKAFLGEPVSILPVRGQRLSLPTNLIWRVDAAEPESSVAQIIESLQKAP
jgi:DNA-binding transcriptional LysR family regulator